MTARRPRFYVTTGEEEQYYPFQYRPNVKTLLRGKLLESGW